MPKLRVGISETVYSRPLAWGFVKGHHGDLFAPSYHRPAVIGQLLRQGNLDIGLVSPLEFRDHPGLMALPDLCVAATGPSRSMVLLSECAPEELTTVIVSHEDVLATRMLEMVLMERRPQLPKLVRQRAMPERLSGSEGVLLAGDAAWRSPAGSLRELNLTEEWCRLTGTPCVYALWAVRAGVHLPDLPFYFKSSLRYGLSLLNNMAREAAADRGLDVSAVIEFLDRQLTFFLRDEERRGLVELMRRFDAGDEPAYWGDA